MIEVEAFKHRHAAERRASHRRMVRSATTMRVYGGRMLNATNVDARLGWRGEGLLAGVRGWVRLRFTIHAQSTP
jgi:hypothetical protein